MKLLASPVPLWKLFLKSHTSVISNCGSVAILHGSGKRQSQSWKGKTTMDNQQQDGLIKPEQNDDHAILRALVARLRIRDAETLAHSERVVRLSLLLGRAFSLSSRKIKSLEYGALL